MAAPRFLLCAAAILGARAQLSPTSTSTRSSTPGVVGCVARYIRIENTPGVSQQNFYVRVIYSGNSKPNAKKKKIFSI